jgi:hypothetical protein
VASAATYESTRRHNPENIVVVTAVRTSKLTSIDLIYFVSCVHMEGLEGK